MTWANRIVSQEEVDPNELLDHPDNWRRHPSVQRAALEGALNEVGWVQNVVVNQRTGRIIDGHLRVDSARAEGVNVPVVYVDLSDDEESIVLASMDTITGLAEHDHEQLAELISSLHVQDDALAELLDTERLRAMEAIEGAQGDQNESGGGNESGTGSEEQALTVMLSPDNRIMVEETLSRVREDYGLDNQSEAMVALCQYYREE